MSLFKVSALPVSRRQFLSLSTAVLASLALAGCATTPHTAPVVIVPTQSAQPVNLTVMSSGGFKAAYQNLKPAYETASGNRLTSVWGPSMGKSPDAIPARLARGENGDVVIMVGYALDKLIASGYVSADSRVKLADSRIGVVVKAGSPRPDVSTVEGLRQTLLNAPSIAYSDSASGVYVEKELFKKLGIENQVKAKARMVQQTPVAERVAAGEFAIGLQQVSEILPVQGATFVGKIPESVQSVTDFSAGVVTKSTHPKEARELIRYLKSPQAQPVIVATGMDSVAP